MHSGMRKTLSFVALVAGFGLLAASALASVSQEPPQNTFRWSLAVDIDYVDPALGYYAPTWALTYATSAKLYNYPDAPATRGSRLVPEVAAGFPAVSKDGRFYTFRLKKTYRLSDGKQVTARHFAHALFRVASRRMDSPGFPFMADIVGAQALNEGKALSLSGVRVLGPQKLQIQLKKASGDLLARLAMPFFSAVPADLDLNPEGVRPPIVSAGPYYISEWKQSRRIILRRNRFYRGPRPQRVERVEVDIGLPLETIKLNIDRGATDAGDIPPSAHAELGRRYGVRRRSPGRYFANPVGGISYLAFNHERGLFGGPTPLGNVRLKQALSTAIDRRDLMNQYGAYAGSVHDQLLPPTTLGFRDVRLYPRRPNLAKARGLAAGNLRTAKGIFYCQNRTPAPQVCQHVQSLAREIGLDLDIRLFPAGFGEQSHRRGRPFDLVTRTWRADYFDPYDFLFLVDGTTIRPANNTNVSYFDSPRFNRRIKAAAALVGEARYEAFSRLDAELMRDVAPVAVYGVQNDRHYVSSRLGCYHHHPVYGWDFPALCLRR
jgi:ABC-type oligopeptide transport system substrate-binding subunit